jgi:hypothetical protein
MASTSSQRRPPAGHPLRPRRGVLCGIGADVRHRHEGVGFGGLQFAPQVHPLPGGHAESCGRHVEGRLLKSGRPYNPSARAPGNAPWTSANRMRLIRADPFLADRPPGSPTQYCCLCYKTFYHVSRDGPEGLTNRPFALGGSKYLTELPAPQHSHGEACRVDFEGSSLAGVERARWCQEVVRSELKGFHISSIRLIYAGLREPTSGLEPLTCSLRVRQ